MHSLMTGKRFFKLDLVEKKKLFHLNKNDVPEHYIKMEKELLQFIYDNKENLIKPPKEKNFPQKETHFGNERKKLHF